MTLGRFSHAGVELTADLAYPPQGALPGWRPACEWVCESEIIVFMSGLADVLMAHRISAEDDGRGTSENFPTYPLWVLCCRHRFLSKGSDHCLRIPK